MVVVNHDGCVGFTADVDVYEVSSSAGDFQSVRLPPLSPLPLLQPPLRPPLLRRLLLLRINHHYQYKNAAIDAASEDDDYHE